MDHIRQYRIDLASLAIRVPSKPRLLADDRNMLMDNEHRRDSQYADPEAVYGAKDLGQEDPEAVC